ncbi:hypothetical protein CEXT_461041 [Caerostris extrusa]|uniref:Uncharacterized protein n=1 Tax=Caerostris extrusa TaxID=172846 RepID=A0AAV4SH95_CAEEX|nr:hypothetical protein CEXT_461041 [Caerostris extrusa]
MKCIELVENPFPVFDHCTQTGIQLNRVRSRSKKDEFRAASKRVRFSRIGVNWNTESSTMTMMTIQTPM